MHLRYNLRMASTTESEARRRAARARWGSHRPRRLAAELTERARDLPPADAMKLIHALTTPTDEDVTHG
jgi:hypothetical protein